MTAYHRAWLPSLLTAAVLGLTSVSIAQNAPGQGNNGATPAPAPAKPWAPGSGEGNLPGPKIQFDAESWNWGTIDQGLKADHTFVVTNAGTGDLVITEAKSSCGCTVPDFSKEPIPPGGRGEVRVSFNSAGRSGKQHKQVSVRSNDPNRPTVNLEVTGDVAAADAGDISLSPMTVDFGMVGAADFVEQEIQVTNRGKKALTIESVAGQPPEVNAYLQGDKVIQPGAEAKIIVTVQASPRTPGGFFERGVTVRCDDPMKPVQRIPVRAYVRAEMGGRLVTVAGEIDVGVIDKPGEKVFSLPVVNSGDGPLTITRVQVAGSSLSVPPTGELVIPAGQTTFIDVLAAPSLRKGVFRDRILFYSSDSRLAPGAATQSVTLFGYVAADNWQQAASNSPAGGTAGTDPNAPEAPGTDHSGHDHSGHDHK